MSGVQSNESLYPSSALCGDPEQEYLADGISENLISSLSQLSDVFALQDDIALNILNLQKL
jgi:TolB-like protein